MERRSQRDNGRVWPRLLYNILGCQQLELVRPMRIIGIIILVGLAGCASPHEPCCTGITGNESNQLSFLHRRDIPEITALVKRETKDGFVGEIWWANRNQAIVCVTDGCWEVLRSSDGRWDTGSHWPKLTPEQKESWLQQQHERIVTP